MEKHGGKFANNFKTVGNIMQILNLVLKKNSVVLVRMRTIPTERPQPVGEVSANFS
jgi:hypothetical protein